MIVGRSSSINRVAGTTCFKSGDFHIDISIQFIASKHKQMWIESTYTHSAIWDHEIES